jgi:hypothetical protein
LVPVQAVLSVTIDCPELEPVPADPQLNVSAEVDDDDVVALVIEPFPDRPGVAKVTVPADRWQVMASGVAPATADPVTAVTAMPPSGMAIAAATISSLRIIDSAPLFARVSQG